MTEKLSLPSGRMIKNLLIIQTEGSKNIAVLPQFLIVDIFNYLIKFREYSYSILRDEGYSLYADSYVLDIETQTCTYTEDYTEDGFFVVITKVNPKTNEPPHDKTNKMSGRPAKTQISLGISPV